MKLSDAVGIVTGGAAGLGKGFAERILAEGGVVLITDINATVLATTGQELAAKFGAHRVTWMRQDVVDADSFHRVFEHASAFFKRAVNLLVNNAGIGGDERFWDDSAPRDWESVITIDLTAVIRGSQVAFQQFRRHLNGQEGVVINISSFAGLNTVTYAPQYAAAKAGVVGFTRSCHHLQKKDNIRVVALCPAFTDTNMGRAGSEYYSEWMEYMGGLMDVGKVVDAFAWSVSDDTNPGRVIRIVPRGTAIYQFPGDKQLYPTAKL